MLDDDRRFSFTYRAFADRVIRKPHLRVARWDLTVCVLLPVSAVFSHVLLVEPDAVFGSQLHQAISDVADIQWVSHFAAARSVLQQSAVDLLVTNLRLGAFNGLHLVHLAALVARRTRAVVYTEWLETGFGRDVQRAGAFYETRPCLAHTLASYVAAALPPKDGRNVAVHDRRQAFRGGRRSADRREFHGFTSGAARII
jgi:ActR/RegA family two-component response regulator